VEFFVKLLAPNFFETAPLCGKTLLFRLHPFTPVLLGLQKQLLLLMPRTLLLFQVVNLHE